MRKDRLSHRRELLTPPNLEIGVGIVKCNVVDCAFNVTGAALVLSFSTRVVNQSGELLAEFRATKPSGLRSFLGHFQSLVPQPGAYVRREVLKLREDLNYVMDWSFYFSLEDKHPGCFWTDPRSIAAFRHHDDSKTIAQANLFLPEKLQFLESFTFSDVRDLQFAKMWAHRQRALIALGECKGEPIRYIQVAAAYPALIKERMYWGAVRRAVKRAVGRA